MLQLTPLSPRAFLVPQFLSLAECAGLIALAEAAGFEAAGVRTHAGPKAMPLVRNNERTLVRHSQWVNTIWQRLAGLALPLLGGEMPAGLP